MYASCFKECINQEYINQINLLWKWTHEIMVHRANPANAELTLTETNLRLQGSFKAE